MSLGSLSPVQSSVSLREQLETIHNATGSKRGPFSQLYSGGQISHILGHDLIWRIFLTNADMEDDSEGGLPAIETLRHSSQVCCDWRRLIVNSPSLWGRVLNINCLRHKDWRKEVLDRTGASELFVRSDSNGLDLEEIVISIMSENWSRMRSLDVTLCSEQYSAPDSSLWSILEKPAKILDFFQLTGLDCNPDADIGGDDDDEPTILSPPDFMIFGNDAPSLGSFYAPNIKFDLRAPWTSHIRLLSLNTPTPLHELLEALNNMLLLESIEVTPGIIRGSSAQLQSLSQVKLPRLMDILLSAGTDSNPYITFLTNLTPLDTRRLIFTGKHSHQTYGQDGPSIKDILWVLYTYSTHAQLAAATKITLFLGVSQFEFEAMLSDEIAIFSFFLQPHFASHYFDNRTLQELFGAVFLPEFGKVRELNLHVEEGRGIYPSDPKFTKFIKSVASVELLTTDDKTLQFLIALPEEPFNSAFPLLKEVEISFREVNGGIAGVHAFLARRITSGRPIPKLSISGFCKLDMSPLEDVVGLKVISVFFPRGEYICGSGSPEELILPSKGFYPPHV